jgi:hypothetical protein
VCDTSSPDHHPLDCAGALADELDSLRRLVGLSSLCCYRVQRVDLLAFITEGLRVLTDRTAPCAGAPSTSSVTALVSWTLAARAIVHECCVCLVFCPVEVHVRAHAVVMTLGVLNDGC